MSAESKIEQPASRNGRPRERLRPAQRLHDPKEFQRVYAGQCKVNTPQLVICYSPNGLTRARLGVSVGVKHGNAVRRNRIKRVLRAAFRQCQHALPPGFDYVLIPRKGGAEFTCAVICAVLQDAAKRVKVKHADGGTRNAD